MSDPSSVFAEDPPNHPMGLDRGRIARARCLEFSLQASVFAEDPPKHSMGSDRGRPAWVGSPEMFS